MSWRWCKMLSLTGELKPRASLDHARERSRSNKTFGTKLLSPVSTALLATNKGAT